MSEVIVNALSLIAILVIGYAIKRAGWATVQDFPLLSKIVLRITLPAALIGAFDWNNVKTEDMRLPPSFQFAARST